jgi:hypothetical protein
MNSSPFKQVASSLVEKGYSVIPLRQGSKAPIEKNWTQYCDKVTDSVTLSTWEGLPDANIGLTLGKASGLVALDFDEDVGGLHEEILKLLPVKTVRKTGARGFTLFYKYNGEKTHKWGKDGEMVLELLSSGRHTVIPPSIHPNGNAYKYESFEELLDIENLPELPENFLEDVNKIFGKEMTNTSVKKDRSFDIQDVKEALSFIDPDEYETWIQVGMALKESVGGEEGFELWDKWSSKSKKYNPHVMHGRWNSFTSGGVSVATIFYHAMEQGFKFKKKFSLEGIINPIDLLDDLEDWRVNGLDIGASAGLGNLDKLVHFRKGEFTVITGYANSGKSEFLDSIAMNLMDQDWKFLYCSLEKTPRSHVQSLVHKYTGKQIKDRTKEEQIEAVEFISKHSAMIGRSKFDSNIDNIVQVAEMYKRIEGLDSLVIDPFNYITSNHPSGYDHTKYATIKCADIAKKLDIHVFLIAHPKLPDKTFLKKDGDQLPRITMYSIAGGSNFANVADIIMSVSRCVDDSTQVDVLKVRDQDIDKMGRADFKFNTDTKRHEPLRLGF